ncbi:hypothetical protein FHG87_015086 [Trinorchestia longiramus]|nr:hypothetical protein FHG87_015086 [Trinorchestia longiramus]
MLLQRAAISLQTGQRRKRTPRVQSSGWDVIGKIQKLTELRRRCKTQQERSLSIRKNTDLTPVLQAFASALTDCHPQIRYQPADLYFKIRCLVATHLPEYVYEALYIRAPE